MPARPLIVLAMAGLLLAGARQQTPARIDGEYGLWVENRRDSMVVHWLTEDSLPGLLRAHADKMDLAFPTPASRAHRAALRRPGGRELRLTFGNANALDTTIISLQKPQRAASASGADSVYVLGDTHGEFDTVVQMLQNARLIDAGLRWTGGRKHLVFNGDLLDRGPASTRLLWFVYGLEPQAARAGGRVHVVLGNHETMIWLRDLRYVHAQEQTIAQAHGVPYERLFDIRESVLGQWLGSKPAILKLDRILFAHGGISADFLPYTVRTFDDSLARFTGEELFYHWNDTTLAIKIKITAEALERRTNLLMGERSVFWYRGYVQSNTQADELERVLKRFGAVVHVVGHTPTTQVHQKYQGKLIAAHPRTPAIEMVLLVRAGSDYQRFRIDLNGALSPLAAAAQ